VADPHKCNRCGARIFYMKVAGEKRVIALDVRATAWGRNDDGEAVRTPNAFVPHAAVCPKQLDGKGRTFPESEKWT